jgi:hypothetical protein
VILSVECVTWVMCLQIIYNIIPPCDIICWMCDMSHVSTDHLWHNTTMWHYLLNVWHESCVYRSFITEYHHVTLSVECVTWVMCLPIIYNIIPPCDIICWMCDMSHVSTDHLLHNTTMWHYLLNVWHESCVYRSFIT